MSGEMTLFMFRKIREVKFKKGDIVVYIAKENDSLNFDLPIGATGTVMEDGSIVPYVNWYGYPWETHPSGWYAMPQRCMRLAKTILNRKEN